MRPRINGSPPHEGHPFRVEVPSDLEGSNHLFVEMDSASGVSFSVACRDVVLRFIMGLGDIRSVRTGDSEFDDVGHVTTDDEDATRAALADAARRRPLLGVIQAGFRIVTQPRSP